MAMEIDQNRIEEILFFGSAQFYGIRIVGSNKIPPNPRNFFAKQRMNFCIFEMSGLGIQKRFLREERLQALLLEKPENKNQMRLEIINLQLT